MVQVSLTELLSHLPRNKPVQAAQGVEKAVIYPLIQSLFKTATFVSPL